MARLKQSYGLKEKIDYGSVEKSPQRRSRQFPVLTYWTYAPRLKLAAALLDDFFEPTRSRWHAANHVCLFAPGNHYYSTDLLWNTPVASFSMKRKMHVVHWLWWELQHRLQTFKLIS